MNTTESNENGSTGKRRYIAIAVASTAVSFVVFVFAIAVSSWEFNKTHVLHGAYVGIGIGLGTTICAWWDDKKKSRS